MFVKYRDRKNFMTLMQIFTIVFIYFIVNYKYNINILNKLRVDKTVVNDTEYHTTFVSAYIKIKSKHSADEYDKWIGNFLALNDPIIIFSTEDMFPLLERKRTNGYPLKLYSINDYVQYDNLYWDSQLKLDPESNIHNSQLYFIWHQKTKLVYKSTLLDPFSSKYFVWSDIGCYRNSEYAYTSQLEHIPSLELNNLFVNIHPYKSNDIFFNKCNGDIQCRRVAAAQFMCERHECSNIYDWFSSTVVKYGKLFIGNDQNILGTMCLYHKCNLFKPNGKFGDVWFGLQAVMALKYSPEIFSVTHSHQKVNTLFIGRLGNQLFQLHAGMQYAERHGATYCLHNSFKYSDIVDVSGFEKCNISGKIVKDKHYGKYEVLPYYQDTPIISLNGYFQSHNYISKMAQFKLSNVEKKKVVIHVRGGDKNNQDWFLFPPYEYFVYNTKGYNNDDVVVVTDDLLFCKRHPILNQFRIISGNIRDDFSLLAISDRIISTSMSTFSWWAALYGNAEFIYYEHEVVKTHPIHTGNFNSLEYYNDDWKSWNPLFMVMGSGHSGTSILTGLLEHSGLVGDSFDHIDEYHPHGLFESKQVTDHNKLIMNGGITIQDTAELITNKLRNIDIVKHPSLSYTIDHWIKAGELSGRPIVPIYAYRHPVDTCNHQNCPNCDNANCFDNIVNAYDKFDDYNSIVFDISGFQKDPWGSYLLLLSKLQRWKIILPSSNIMKVIDQRHDIEPTMINGDVYKFYNKVSTITPEILSLHGKFHKEYSETTVISGLWDLGRDDRSIGEYKAWLHSTIKSTDHPIVLFTNLREYDHYNNVIVIHIEAQHLPYAIKYLAKNKRLLLNDTRIENKIPMYNIVQWSKISMMRMVSAFNPHNSTKFMWLDAGISRFGNEFNIKRNDLPDGFLISMQSNKKTVVCGNPSGVDSFLSGGILISDHNGIKKMDNAFDNFLTNTKVVNNDQILWLEMWCNDPDIFTIVQTERFFDSTIEFQHIINDPSLSYHIFKKYAISTMLIDADDSDYVLGAIKLVKSLSLTMSTKDFDFVLLELIERPLSFKIKEILINAGWKIKSVHRIKPHDEKNTFPRFRDQFTKLQLWDMTEYQRIIYLDSDTLVIKDISSLVKIPMSDNVQIVASKDIADGKWRTTFNMGMFMIKPDHSEYTRLLKMKDTVKFETAMSEQGFLNVVYKGKWLDPGFEFNANIAAFSQIPTFWKSIEEKIRIIHYTMEKPWKCSYTYKKLCDLWRNL